QQEYSYTGSDCLICHQTPFGEKGNATKDFALTLQGMGLVSEQPNLLRSVMSELEAELEQTPEEATDSDGDGVPDLVEITDQGDPNDPTIKPGGFTPVEYGCSIVKPVGHSGQSRDENPLAFMLSTLVAGALLLDRRRRQRRSA